MNKIAEVQSEINATKILIAKNNKYINSVSEALKSMQKRRIKKVSLLFALLLITSSIIAQDRLFSIESMITYTHNSEGELIQSSDLIETTGQVLFKDSFLYMGESSASMSDLSQWTKYIPQITPVQTYKEEYLMESTIWDVENSNAQVGTCLKIWKDSLITIEIHIQNEIVVFSLKKLK